MPPVFPNTTLGLKVELNLNAVWTDITQYVMTRDNVVISGAGRADWTSTLQAATLTLTLKNTGGRFTPKNSAGAYYPYITRNVQVRVSVNSQSVTGVAYSGYRFFGEVAEWPPAWDVSGRDLWVSITANGIWRRISQLATPLGSAYRRYTTALAGIRSYWPMEDGTGSGSLVPYGSVAGTGLATQSFIAPATGLSLAACTDFKGSDAIPQLNAALITCTIPAGGTPTNNVTRFLLSVPAAGDSAAGGGNWCIAEINSAGTCAHFEIYLTGTTKLLMQLRNSSNTLLAQATTTTSVNGAPFLVSAELTPSGGNVNFALRIISQGAAGITESMTGTLTSASVGAISTIRFSRANDLMDSAVGHCYVSYSAPQSMVSAAYALNGYIGEKAADRFTRVCGEMGITSELVGTAASSAAMGPQVDGTLSDLLQSIEDVDCGLLYESRTQFGLGYRTLTSLSNQSAAAAISYTTGPGLDPSLAPAYDDQLSRNNVTVTNWTGYTQQAILTAGAMSINSPPSGIGNGYGYTRSVNAAADSQMPGIANWLLNVGSSDDVRIPVVTVKLARAAAAGMFATLPGLAIGDYIQVTNLPSWMPSGTVKLLVAGYTETIRPKEWTIAWNTVPESPYETGFSPGTVQTAQLPGGSPVTSAAPGAGGLAGIIANGSITPAMLNEGITVKTLGGTKTTISTGAPSNPNTGDIWINATTALISQWNGSSWVAYKFDASQTIQAGSIVTANIAAQAITASLIAAGTVFAGIVDATTVKAAEYDAFNTGGEFFAYDTSSPTTGHLTTSIAGSSGTDTASNNYPKGLLSQQLTLPDQASPPTAFSGASSLYTSSSGRLRYLNAMSVDMVLDRSNLNLNNKTMGTQTIAQQMSQPLAYIANEAQVGSEYEIEIDGTLTTPTATNAAVYNWSFFIDGSGSGISNVTVGTTMMATGLTIAYTVRARLTVNTTGAGGTCDVIFDGGAVIQKDGASQFNLGNMSPTGHAGGGGGMGSTPLHQITTGVAIDTTTNHTFQIYGNWGSTTGTGHSAITYRTKLVRRN